VVDYGLAAITVSIFLLDHGLAVMWLPLLNHGGMIAVTVAVLIVRLANRYASRPDRREHQLRPPTLALR
jgi:hypothetical protein